MNSSSDCRTPEGIAIGLIDGIISMCRVLRTLDLSDPNIEEALKDLRGDEDLDWLLYGDKGSKDLGEFINKHFSEKS